MARVQDEIEKKRAKDREEMEHLVREGDEIRKQMQADEARMKAREDHINANLAKLSAARRASADLQAEEKAFKRKQEAQEQEEQEFAYKNMMKSLLCEVNMAREKYRKKLAVEEAKADVAKNTMFWEEIRGKIQEQMQIDKEKRELAEREREREH
ncbi:unnamed protein product [Discula destructiva]